MFKVYGLKNCDTCRKAKKWLSEEGIESTVHDIRKDGLEAGQVAFWAQAVGWEILLNRRGTTWRGLSEAEKSDLTETKAIALMEAAPALMKRPIFVSGETVHVGFKPADQGAVLTMAKASA